MYSLQAAAAMLQFCSPREFGLPDKNGVPANVCNIYEK
jgi:hypothetical protein